MDYANDLTRARERKRRRAARLRFAAVLLLLAGYWVYRVPVRSLFCVARSRSGGVEVQRESKPLVKAVDKGNIAAVGRLLDSGVSPDAVAITDDMNGDSVLMSAAAEGHLEIARLLLDRGADMNISNGWGRTVLYEAAEEGQPEMVRLLVRRGADPNADYDGSMILGVAEGALSESKSEPERRRLQETVQILQDAGAADNLFSWLVGWCGSLLALLIAAIIFVWTWFRG